MNPYSANSYSRAQPADPAGSTIRLARPAQDSYSPLTWARQRLTERNQRRLTAAGQRAEHRLHSLGPDWYVVEWPPGLIPSQRSRERGQECTGFLTVGPGGVYAISVVNHGRQRVMLAGDVIQIQGRRPPLIPDARRDARKASVALTAAVGARVPVVPVVTFVGSGSISAQGLPKNCLVAPYRELDHLMRSAGEKISAVTARKLADVASHPATWADQYRWYPEGQTAGDNSPTRR